MTTIATAAREYARRPKDERFASPLDMLANAQQDKDFGREVGYNLKDLRVNTLNDGTSLGLVSPKGIGRFTHWSFSQLARTLKAPAGYVSTLPPQVAADALNYGIQNSLPGTKANILIRTNNPGELPTVRAATSDTYGRVWDADLYSALHSSLLNTTTGQWKTPPTWDGKPAGAYRGDRDSFLIVVNGGSIVTDPSITSGNSNSGMFRGVLVRNSEVGASAITIEQVLFRYICGNHLLWGAVIDRQFRRRHVGLHTLRDTLREVGYLAATLTNRAEGVDRAIIQNLLRLELAHTQEGVVDELRKMGFTKEQAQNAYAACERTESASPRSFWGIAQGATRLSQESGFQDERLQLDRLAAQVLAKGARVAA